MSDAEEPEPLHPRETTAWFGHAEAEGKLLDATGGLLAHGTTTCHVVRERVS